MAPKCGVEGNVESVDRGSKKVGPAVVRSMKKSSRKHRSENTMLVFVFAVCLRVVRRSLESLDSVERILGTKRRSE